MRKSGEFWFLVREAANQPDAKLQALYYWLTPVDGVIITNEAGYPLGVPLRPVAKKLAELGYCNGKGREFHPYQLQEMIDEGFPDAAKVVLQVELTEEQRQALKETFSLGRRFKRGYEHLSEEDSCRQSWRRLKRPIKRRIPWDQRQQ